MTKDIPPDLQSALAERYELRRVLGQGGMATVYLAYDDKHRREVALKVLVPGLAAFLGVERFLRRSRPPRGSPTRTSSHCTTRWAATRRGASQRDLEVAVSVRGGRTRITIQENLGPLIGGIYGGIGGGMGGGGMGPMIGVVVGGLHLPAALPFIIPLWLATTYATARTAFHYSTKRRTRELVRLADRLAALARELIPPQRPAVRGAARPLPP